MTNAGAPAGILAIALILASSSVINLVETRPHPLPNPYQQSQDHVNVPVLCGLNRHLTEVYLSDHHCVSTCPPGFDPGHLIIPDPWIHVDYFIGNPPCMKSDGTPVSIYDLAGWQVSADNGTTIYSVISDIPLAKAVPMDPGIRGVPTLQVSPLALDALQTVSFTSTSRTRIGTIGDEVGAFTIRSITIFSVKGDLFEGYPVFACCKSVTLHDGDEVDIFCRGYNGTLTNIDFQDQTVAFTVPGFC